MPQGGGEGRGRRRSRRLVSLWPACLCSDSAAELGKDDDQDDDTPYTLTATATDEKNKMAADVMTSSPDVDAGGGGELCTVHMSGGAPLGFRLVDDGKGALVVGKVCLPVRVRNIRVNAQHGYVCCG